MKHLIKIESVAHGVLGVRHAGLDQQYCEAGELVTLKWQPDAGWGLQEAHYTDKDGNVSAIEGGSFTMPNKEITIGGTFKKFVVQDWTGVGQKGEAMMVGDNGEPIPNNNVTMSADGNVSANGNVSADGNVSAGKDVYFGGNGYASSIFLYDREDPTIQYRIQVENGGLICKQV